MCWHRLTLPINQAKKPPPLININQFRGCYYSIGSILFFIFPTSCKKQDSAGLLCCEGMTYPCQSYTSHVMYREGWCGRSAATPHQSEESDSSVHMVHIGHRNQHCEGKALGLSAQMCHAIGLFCKECPYIDSSNGLSQFISDTLLFLDPCCVGHMSKFLTWATLFLYNAIKCVIYFYDEIQFSTSLRYFFFLNMNF